MDNHLTEQQKCLIAIGAISVGWSHLEYTIQACIWQLLDIKSDNIGYSITAHIVLPVKLDILTSLSNEIIGDRFLHRRLLRIIKKIRNLQTERNKIVHNKWYGTADSDSPYIIGHNVSARGKYKSAVNHISNRELENLYEKIIQVERLLDKYYLSVILISKPPYFYSGFPSLDTP